jgi:RNA polymerase sigma-70 factor (ECF subfamily)
MQTKQQLEQLLASAGVMPNKRLGQHFLIDLNLLRLLVDAAHIHNDDVVVEVMVEVYRSVGSFRGDSSLRTWLFSVVRNVCRQELRRSTRQRRRPRLPSLSPATPDPAEVFHEQDRRTQVITALARLPQKYRLALALHYLAHCSYQEVAQILRIPLGTAKSRIWQGLRSLGKLLPKDFTDDN